METSPKCEVRRGPRARATHFFFHFFLTLTTMRPSVNAASNNGGGSSSASPSSGGGGSGGGSGAESSNARNNKNGKTSTSSASSTVFLRPHVYSYTCRGALHMESGPNANAHSDADINTSNKSKSPPPSTGRNSGDVQNLQGLPLCHGIATKLRHVTTLPTARTSDEAVQMFQQVLPATKVVASNDENAYERAAGNGGGHHHDHHSATPTRGYDPSKPLTHSVSCYGSTDVNVLTVQEIETAPVGVVGDDEGDDGEAATIGRSRRSQQQQQPEFQDPFEAMLGSVFGGGGSAGAGGGPGGIFGPFGGFNGGASSRSVSQSTRVVNGQTITTKEVTTVDPNGKRHVEKETTIRNRDGTVEVIKGDGSGGGMLEGKSDAHEAQGSGGSKNQNQHMGQVFPPVATPFGGRSPFGLPAHRIVRQSEPQVVAVVPECKLGVTVSNVETDTEGDTIASFRVGPVEVAVGDSYDIVEEDGDSSRQYGDGTATNNDSASGHGDNSGDRRRKKEWNMDEIEAKLLSTMDKTAASMKKNAEMLSDAVSDDFPSRILKGGERVVGNFDKTLDRMAKLASDLYGWASGDSGRK